MRLLAIFLLWLGIQVNLYASGSVQEKNGQVSAPNNFWLFEGGLMNNPVDAQFQSAVQAVQIIGGSGGVTNAFFRSTPTVTWTPVGGTNLFSVPPLTYDSYGQAVIQSQAAAQVVSNSFNWYTLTTNGGFLIWQYNSPTQPGTVWESGNFGAGNYTVQVITNGTISHAFSFKPTGIFGADFLSGDGTQVKNLDSGHVVNITGTIPSNSIPTNLGVFTLTINSPSSANAVAMLGLGADGRTVVSNPVPAGSVAPKFISGTNTVYDQPGGSNRFNVPNSAFSAVTSGYPWTVLSQPASLMLSNVTSGNGQASGVVITNLQLIQYATVQLTNAGASKFTSTLAANGNTNLILILNTNFVSNASTTNVLNGSSLPGTGWTISTDAVNDLVISNSGPGNASFLFSTNGPFIVGLGSGATLQLGYLTNNMPAGTYGNGSFLSTTNGQYYGVSNSAVFQMVMP